MTRCLPLILLALGCSPHDARPDGGVAMTPAPPASTGPSASHFVLVGGTVVGVGQVDVTVDGATVEALGNADGALAQVDVSGRYLVPAFIDSHVHLAYYPVAEQLLARGVVAAVDLAAPLDAFSLDAGPLTLLASGPMVTAKGGYPTLSWGRDGYGLEVGTVAETEAAVDELAREGAALIKTPFTAEPTLDDELAAAVVTRSHGRGLKVAAHALGASDAERAARADVDLLAHTPVEPLLASTLAAFSRKAVVSTLGAFGGSAAAVENLRALREAGATVLYGTDLGNSRDAGIQASEIQLLLTAGLDGAAILEAGTSAPARYFGLSHLGAIAPGKRAALLVLAADPLVEPQTLAEPVQVFIDGQLVE